MILSFEKKISLKDPLNLGFSYDLLYTNDKIELTKDEKCEIVSRLEKSLNEHQKSHQEFPDPWRVEQIVRRLANHYKKNQENGKIPGILNFAKVEYEKVLKEAANIQQVNWLSQLYNLYKQYNLKNNADDILVKIKEIGPDVHKSMKEISHTTSISNKDLSDFLNEITEGDLNTVLKRISGHFIPAKTDTKQQLLELSKNNPITYIVNNQLFDESGRTKAIVNSLEADLQGHLILLISQNLNFSSFFMHKTLERACSKFELDADILINYLMQCPIINHERIAIIKNGLKAHFSGDYLTSIHLIIPQIEDSVRRILELSGGAVLKPNNFGGFYYKNFDEILRDSIVQNSLGEDFCLYFQVLFTDIRGWNLRNDVSHGLANTKLFNQQTGERVFHALLCLGLVEEKSSPK